MKNILSTIVISFILVNFVTNAQDITNTLAPNGNFKIKDGSSDFFSLDQSTGNISIFRNIELGGITNSTSAIGVITKNGLRFIHNYGNSNTFIGINSGNFIMTGSENSAFGYNSFLSNTEGFQNSIFGVQSLMSNTTGLRNSAFGYRALYLNTVGNYNSSFGYQSLTQNISGEFNSAFGVAALLMNTTGSLNSAYGFYALRSNTNGYQNVAIGTEALYMNSSGNKNTAVGHRSLYYNTTGFQNTAVGDSALYQNRWGNYNTAIGYNAGSIVVDGANLTLIGTDANPSYSNAVDQITLGNQYVQSLRCNVQTITSLSDARDKKNIQDLTLGLDFITKLKPRQFNWDRREWYDGYVSDGSKMKETPTAGFIAQEFDEVQKSENAEWLNLVLKDNPEKWEATYGNLLPVMVKAIQELAIKNEELTIKNEQLTIKKDEEITELKNRLSKYEEMQTMLVKELEQIKSNQQNFKVQLVNSEINNQ